MELFNNILFVSQGINEKTTTLEQTIKLATLNKANLDILILLPALNDAFIEHQNSYEEFLIAETKKHIAIAKTALNLNHENIDFKIEVEFGNTHDIRIIQKVLRNEYDLLVKASEPITHKAKGFKALDMELLRKCPCTLYLHHDDTIEDINHIAVAIDPKDAGTENEKLAIKLLHLAHALEKLYQAELTIISCWDFPLDSYMQNRILTNMSQKKIDVIRNEESQKYHHALESMINKANIKSRPIICYLEGNPVEVIPSVLHKKDMDVIIMGTVARTGIAGFVIGNTAENILQRIDCSLWALKPDGFISPVKI